MAARYGVAPVGGIAFDANEPMGALWNTGTSSQRLYVTRISVINTAAIAGGSKIQLFRTSARGTAGSSNAADVDSAFDHRVTSPAGGIVDRSNFSANPTQLTPALMCAQISDAAGAEVCWGFPVPLQVLAGQGLAVYGVTAGTASMVAFVWDED